MENIKGIEINGYSNHLVLIDKVFEYQSFKGQPIETVFEYGCGFGSTKYFCENAKQVVAVEMQSKEWFVKVTSLSEAHDNLELVWRYGMEGVFEILEPKHVSFSKNLTGRFDMVFVDGHGDTRPECINLVGSRNLSDIIISHDTEEKGYRWNIVDLPHGYHSYTMKKFNNFTTIWTKDLELIEYLNKELA
jgi:predicted O-methyltransferase YrrM